MKNKVLSAEKIFKIQYHRAFKQIYKANQCTDLNDVREALYQLNNLSKWIEGRYTYEMTRRLVSLTKKELQLKK